LAYPLYNFADRLLMYINLCTYFCLIYCIDNYSSVLDIVVWPSKCFIDWPKYGHLAFTIIK